MLSLWGVINGYVASDYLLHPGKQKNVSPISGKQESVVNLQMGEE